MRDNGSVHLLPRDRRNHRIIDEERVCAAIAAISDRDGIRQKAAEHTVLADPTRLTLLLCIEAAGPISVSDLAAASGLADATVSQTLRYLRAAGIVRTTRDGRVIRYELLDTSAARMLGMSKSTTITSG
jgi:DNA-binding transcriptional ArsR family regulator